MLATKLKRGQFFHIPPASGLVHRCIGKERGAIRAMPVDIFGNDIKGHAVVLFGTQATVVVRKPKSRLTRLLLKIYYRN